MVKRKRVPKGCVRGKNFYRCRVADPKKFDKRSLRTLKRPRGRRIIIGCPKGEWSVKKKRCKVGTRIQSKLIPVK